MRPFPNSGQPMLLPIEQRIAAELGVQPRQVIAAVQLLDEGATVPFVARYRKEVTGGLDDTQLRNLEERLGYLRELEDRRAAVINSIAEQGKLDPALREAIENAETKQRLEDLYLPFKQKRRTKAQIAREAGIAPLADALLADPTLTPETEAAAYLNADAGFAPICAPSQCPWGEKAFSNYLGTDQQVWLQHDATALVQAKGALFSEILIDQGLKDQFYSQLNPALFQQACDAVGQKLSLREHAGYDHGYYFIQSFIDQHLQFHAVQLQAD